MMAGSSTLANFGLEGSGRRLDRTLA